MDEEKASKMPKPKDAISVQDPVPKRFWFTIGGSSRSLPPTWDRLLTMATERNKVRLGEENQRREYKQAAKRAKEELEAAKKTHQEAWAGGADRLETTKARSGSRGESKERGRG